jgi:tripartite-type tricarboxylate transporter receptor subunit TctC
MKKKIATGLVLGVLLASTVLAGCANKGVMSASKFPTKPITILNSSAAGSPTDVLAREVARQAEKTLGKSVVVENATC